PVPGQFPQSFSNVHELAKHLTGLSLDDLQTFLSAEKIRSGEKVELLGAKLPSESIANWGLAILLAIAAYFFAVFRDFTHRVQPDDAAWKVPWIGTSIEAASRIVFICTILIPPSTAAYLAWHGIHSVAPLLIKIIYYGITPFIVGSLMV